MQPKLPRPAHPTNITGGLIEDACGTAVGAPVVKSLAATGYREPAAPNQWFGACSGPGGFDLALVDASGLVVVHAVACGSQQSN